MLLTKDYPYISLHTHTTRSIGDAILKLDDYIAKAKELNLKAISVTNHGTMSDVIQVYKKAKEADLKPILGCEVYVCEDKTESKTHDHLVLIAKNKIGFKNLLAIHNDAQINGFYYKPRTDYEFLKKHSEGIIALSACVGGTIPKLILESLTEKCDTEALMIQVLKKIKMFREIFKDFYLEIQPGSFLEQIVVNNTLIEISNQYNIPLVITNDVHYLNKEDYLAHNVHVCANRKKEIAINLIYPDTVYYMMSNEDLYNNMKMYDESIVDICLKNVYNIIDGIEDYDLIKDEIYMPKYDVPYPYTEETYVEKLCFERLEEISYKLQDPSEYVDRIYYELDTIKELGFCGYFLTVRDYIMWSREHFIQVGPGRGSCCGSLVAYLMKITNVDPIKYDLLFERFLSIHRKSVPDIDVDFDALKRDKVFSYVVNKYGKEHCALVSTFAQRKAKAALKDTGRTYGIDKDIYEHVASLVPTVYYIDDEDGETEKLTDISIKETIEIVPEFKKYYKQYPDWINAAIKLENIPKSTSIHAAGTIISPIVLNEIIPLIKSKNENLLATAYDLKDAETSSLIKFDFLSLSTLGVIGKTLKLINKKNTDFIDDNYNDPNVWNIIGSKYTTGLFQIGSRTYKQRMRRLAPKTIKELASCLALVRGPCIASKDDEKYIQVLEGKIEIEKVHPLYDEITERTNGILIYQEQLMQICFNFGFPLHEGYKIMKFAAKKKIDELKKYEEQFLNNAKELGVEQNIAEKIFKKIVDSGLYSFNESHAVAYAILCYITAYLKYHFPKEYMIACLTNAYERKENTEELIEETYRLGFKFRTLNINESNWDFSSLEDNIIGIGICAIKSFGYKAFEEIERKRPFDSMKDFLEKVEKQKCNKKSITAGIFAGLFSNFIEDRKDMYCEYCTLSNNEIIDEITIQGQKEKLLINSDLITFEKTYLSCPIISNPINYLEPIDLNQKGTFIFKGMITNIKKIKDKNKNNMAFVTLATGSGSIECIVFANVYEQCKKSIKKSFICDFSLYKGKNDSYIAKKIEQSFLKIA